MANDLLSALRTYLTKISSGEKTPQEVAAALNAWARESGEAIKVKIEEEVKKNVSRMGFAKASDLKRLEREVMELKSLIKGKTTNAKKKPVAKKKAVAAKAKKPKSASKKAK
ncbi:MAG: hypothetical protein FGM63_05930 [Candidatus Nanopelagicaceae bacterium]|nr:hypothetical protein [Candidatus Nanopelagicaceae bacterium]